MNLRKLLSLGLAVVLAGFMMIGCGKDDEPVVGAGGDREVKVAAVTTPPNTGDIINDPVWDDIDIASIWIGTDSAYGSYFGPGVVRVQAIQDGQNLYMRFNWVDSSETKKPGHWIFQEGPTPFLQVTDTIKGKNGNQLLNIGERLRNLWENEDALALFIDYGNNGSERANCGSTCHLNTPNDIGETHYTTGGGNIDCWIWRAGRTDPFGIAEDFFWGAQQKYDQFDVALYQRNARDLDTNFSEPRLMHTSGPLFTGDQLFTQDTTLLMFVGQNWQPGDHISGYIYNQAFNTGNKSRYDVNAQAEYDAQMSRWNLVLWRTLAAPNPAEDVAFEAGHSYEATLAIMRQNMQRHSGSQPFTLKFE
ncbi:MAG: hypothetical protein IT585_13510 [candidate division Zixibacteria bacterium]|nr:hypothetical protein [candidate division Zixibacteria bacterium]